MRMRPKSSNSCKCCHTSLTAFRNEREIDKRLLKLEDLKEKMDGVSMEVRMTLAGNSFNGVSLNDDEENSSRKLRGEDGEFDDTRDQDERTVL